MMRNTLRLAGTTLCISLLALASQATAQTRTAPAPRAGGAAPAVIGSHQIDRFEAINQLQQSLKEKPDNAADWVILGELAHEVALDLPADQDRTYYKMSREAYEKALRLEPNNAGLKAAVQFAREQEDDAPKFDQRRKEAVAAYLAARRQEVAQNNLTPTVETYSAPSVALTSGTTTAPAPQPAAPVVTQPAPVAGAPVAGTATMLPAQAYPYTAYRPFTTTQGNPYTYQQFSNSYLAPTNFAGQPMTLRQYAQGLPQALMNSVGRGALRPR